MSRRLMPRDFTRAQEHMENVQYAEDDFFYTTGFSDLLSIAPGTSASTTIQIEADSYFKWIKSTYRAWAGATDGSNLTKAYNARQVPNALVEITDSGSGRKLQNTPVPIDSVFGTAEFPYILPLPRIFLPRSTITFEVTNLATAGEENLNVALDLHGLKGFEG
jgi:hypothetical protein